MLGVSRDVLVMSNRRETSFLYPCPFPLAPLFYRELFFLALFSRSCIIVKIKNEPPRSKLRGISRLVAALQTKQASGNMTRRDLKGMIAGNGFHFIVCEFAPFLPDHAFDWIPVPCDLIMVHDLYILYRFIQD